MVDPTSGPFLFETSAESWLNRSASPQVQRWVQEYRSRHPVHVSAITLVERMRGYGFLWHRAATEKRDAVNHARLAYFKQLGRVWPLDAAASLVSAEIMILLPDPPSSPRRSHQLVESRSERLARWRFDCMIAATALVLKMPLIHNNESDFESIRRVVEQTPNRFPGLGQLSLISCSSLA